MSEIQSRYSKKYKFFIWVLLVVIGSFFIFAFGIESIFTSGDSGRQDKKFFSINGKGVYNEPGGIVSEIYMEMIRRYRSMGMNINEEQYGNMILGQAVSQAKDYLLQTDYAEKNKLFLSDEQLLYFLKKDRQDGRSILDSIKESLKGYSKANQIANGKQQYFKTILQNAYLDYTSFMDFSVSALDKKLINEIYSIQKEATIAYIEFSEKQLLKEISLTDLKKYYDANQSKKYQNKKYEEISADVIQKDYLNENREVLFDKISLPVKTKLEKELLSKNFTKNFFKIAKKLKLKLLKTKITMQSDDLVDSRNKKKSIQKAKKLGRLIMMTPNYTNTSIFTGDNLIATALVGKTITEKPDNFNELVEKEQQIKSINKQLFINSLKKEATIVDGGN